MMSASLERLPSYYLEEKVEIHENERSWIGGGFSKSGLLPNDRGRYSTPDGTLSWKTLLRRLPWETRLRVLTWETTTPLLRKLALRIVSHQQS